MNIWIWKCLVGGVFDFGWWCVRWGVVSSIVNDSVWFVIPLLSKEIQEAGAMENDPQKCWKKTENV